MKADTPPRDPPRVPVMVTLVNGGGEPSQRVVAKTVESRDEIAKNVEHFPMLSRGAARRPQQHSSTASLSSRYVDSLRSKMRGSSNALKCPISLPAFLAQVCSTPCALPRPIIAHQDQEARQATLHSTSRLFETLPRGHSPTHCWRNRDQHTCQKAQTQTRHATPARVERVCTRTVPVR